jgi:hypothetical protein
VICTVPQNDRIVSERLYPTCDFIIMSPSDTFLSEPGSVLVGYCKTDYVLWFFEQCKKHPETKYILITHQSDYPITDKLFFKKPRNVVKWYGQNIDYHHPILESIPIGSHVSTWIGTDKDADIKHHPDYAVIPETNIEKKNKNLAYMNFGIWTNTKHRREVYDYFKDKPWVTSAPCDIDPSNYGASSQATTVAELCQEIYDHKFVISPIGNGYDCGRNWLALYLGSIPVIPWHKNMDFYRDMPFIVYRDIEEITEDFLEQKYKEVASRDYSLDKAKVSYWNDKIIKQKLDFS